MPEARISIEGKNGGEHELEVEFTFSIGNDGIGSYEYWGCKGYDKGFDYIDEITIISIYLIGKGNKKRRIELPDMLDEIEEKIHDEFDFEGEVAPLDPSDYLE